MVKCLDFSTVVMDSTIMRGNQSDESADCADCGDGDNDDGDCIEPNMNFHTQASLMAQLQDDSWRLLTMSAAR